MSIDIPRIDYKNKSTNSEKAKTDLEIAKEYNKKKGQELKSKQTPV